MINPQGGVNHSRRQATPQRNTTMGGAIVHTTGRSLLRYAIPRDDLAAERRAAETP
jgi:hypothetical protein